MFIRSGRSRVARVLQSLLFLIVVTASVRAQTSSPSVSPSSNPPEASPASRGSDNALLQSYLTDPRILGKLRARALVVRVAPRIYDEKDETLWKADQTRVTVDGLPIYLRLESAIMVIVAEVTPYRQPDSGMLLVVQCQVFLRSSKEKSLQYTTSIKSIQTKAGEAVLFYPLGNQVMEGQAGISLQLSVSPFQ